MNPQGFKLPKQFLSQLSEFSRGYYLAVVNDRGEIESFESYDNPTIRLGLLNFVDAQSSAAQENLRNQALHMEEMGDRDSRPPKAGGPDEDDDD